MSISPISPIPERLRCLLGVGEFHARFVFCWVQMHVKVPPQIITAGGSVCKIFRTVS